ncbi:tRNA (adenosine(37)-N6)-threonylcarbamoyltransferase complex dimerization subunit type 1 TsaB [Ramlibacter tataouinensis]|uniref:Gcp-like domain-containing protein n=1 Tax=Ramlibacter tataouinensis (strain ATCC BAA-407 / DSM 14655 / LMG 21543 / TTB310) TaxID=365046 RepID=F5Y217_RAMTT|nr:tRNA (adenosine(37)-N6)-threonylcarbamoyltransferase complex dimerization subunit type 1 TsaB [Ramlibacter tataouinensis]AEG94785.1 Conserved hypothetical protein [Ramlibacter tataouinensis TTB310]
MNLLAFDTSTETLSLALAWRDAQGAPQQLNHQAPGGAHASATLIPQAMAMLARAGLPLARLEAIVFGCGPGSFTGLRTACAVAQGLAFGAGRPVLPVETLLAVAEQARQAAGATRVVAVLDARMDEVYSAAYVLGPDGWHREGALALCAPESVVVPPGFALAGNAFGAYGTRLRAAAGRIEALPSAQALLRLAPALIAAGAAVPAEAALPLYIRDKVAQTTAERAAAAAR